MTVIFGTVASVNAYRSFAPWRMIPPHSCVVAGQEAGHVDERQQRDVERVARAHEARGLDARVDVEHAGHARRLVADDADRVAVEAREAADDVRRVVLVDLVELAVVDDRPHDVAHVVGLVRVRRHDVVELGVHPLRVVGRQHARRGLEVVGRQEAQQVARVLQALAPRPRRRSARRRSVVLWRHRAAELLEARPPRR